MGYANIGLMKIKKWILLILSFIIFIIFILDLSQVLFAGKNDEVLNPFVAYITNAPEPSSEPTVKPTKIPAIKPTMKLTRAPTLITSEELENLFTEFSYEYSIDKELLKRIAKCESNFNSNTINKNYIGLFQFSDQSWISIRNNMGKDTNPDLRFNPEESMRTAAFLISQNKLSLWPNCNR